jgi:transcriptional regulator with XRE-family HTH domain
MLINDEMTDVAFLKEAGGRLEQMRLARNLIRSELAEQAGISLSTLERIESGESVQLTNFIRLCRALGILNLFENVLSAPQTSPVTQLRLQKNTRQRASRKRTAVATEWKWGEDE